MFYQEALPIQNRDRITAVENYASNAEPAIFGGAAVTNTSADVAPLGLTAPSNVVVTQGGTAASTNYTYIVADVGNVGVSASAGTQTTTGAATLTAVNFNTVTWNATPYHTYNVYRSASSGTPSGTGLIGTMTAGLGVYSLTMNDTGITGTGGVPGSASGCIAPSGPLFEFGVAAAVSTVGAATLTVGNVLSGLIVRSGTQSAGFTDTLPTAAQLVASAPGIKIGAQFGFFVRNTCATYTETIAVGTGITSAAGNTLTIATDNQKQFLLVFTGVAVGSEAAVLYSCGAASAY